jgi:hypothetical protein
VGEAPADHRVLANWPMMFGEKMKAPLMLIGMIGLGAGFLFVGQGFGYIRWPAGSFMISEIKWVYYGGAIAAVGIALIIIARR